MTSSLESFTTPFSSLFKHTGVLGFSTKKTIVDRFELNEFVRNRSFTFSNKDLRFFSGLNTFFSQFTSVNGRLKELHKLTLIRLYLIRSCRGRSHALGKPSRGQRTWSNAWTAYRLNKHTRSFIRDFQQNLLKERLSHKVNYKLTAKRVKTKTSISLVKKKKKLNVWF